MGNVSFKYRFFQIPACGDEIMEAELNAFLSSKSVVDVRQEFAQGESGAHWCLSVRWRDGSLAKDSPGKGKAMVDYKDVLGPEDFAVFARLRETRKELAKSEQVPAYAIFTNEQLAQMAKDRPTSANAMAKIEGVGKSRIEKYGASFLEPLKEAGPGESAENKS